ncbi:MAG: hypothetical protein ACM3H7_04965, partial [Acidobacteriaceae bacterium]
MHPRTRSSLWLILTGFLLAACNSFGFTPTLISTAMPTASSTGTSSATVTIPPTPTPTHTLTPSITPTITRTPTQTPTPTPSSTPTTTPSPTFAFPTVSVLMQANCRYGPGKAYLYAWGMYTGDTGTVWGRNDSGTWLWIQPDKIKYQCWISSSVVEIHGDIFTLRVAPVRLPQSTLYGPPSGVTAQRSGDQVIVTWQPVSMTEDDNRGYMIEANVCQGDSLVWMAVATVETTFTFTDESTCSEASSGLLY